MAPCSRTALRLLTSVLLLSSLVSAAVLPARYIEVLDSRADKQLDVPVTLNSNGDPKNFFADLIDFIDRYDFNDLWKNIKGGLFGGRKQRPESTTEIGTKEKEESAAAIGPLETSAVTTSPVVSTTASTNGNERSETSGGSSSAGSGSTTSIPTTTAASSFDISSTIISSSVESVSIPSSTSNEPSILRTWPSLSTSEGIFNYLPWPYPTNKLGPTAPSGGLFPNGTSLEASSRTSDLSSPYPTNGWDPTATPPGYFTPNDTSVAVSSRISNLPEFLYPLNVNITSTSELNSTSTVPGPATFTDEFPVNSLYPTIGYVTESMLSTSASSIAGPEPYMPTVRFTLPFRIPTGSAMPEIQIVPYPSPSTYPDLINGTITIKQISTKVITRTLIPPTTRPRWTNGTTLPSSTGGSAGSTSITDPVVITYSAPSSVPSTTYPYDSVIPLREICSNSNKDTISLPLLSLFYGPNAYPALHRFPGCTAPASNSSQAIRAPGLLNCTDLGVEVQGCQRKGHKVLLSVKASGAGEVGGNTEYGDPTKNPQPFGPYFGSLGKNGSIQDAVVSPRQPNLFDAYHPPSAFALTLFSLFSEGHTERADLRPLGPLALDGMTDDAPDGVKWWSKPLGEEVVVDGFDVQIPREWEGTYQEEQFIDFISRLRELTDAAWAESGSKKGGLGDLGADGKGVVYQGWV